MSLEEENEYELIKGNLQYDACRMKWTARYPFKRDPKLLPNNRYLALMTLKSMERRLLRHEEFANMYRELMNDMFNRQVARKVTEEKLHLYTVPKYYIAHHAVLKPESKSTPCRIVRYIMGCH